MKNSTYLSCNGVPWQATCVCLSLNFRDKLLAAIQAPDTIHDRAPKKLTDEAYFMIFVMLVFIGLAVLGSSITIYEFLYKDSGNIESRINGYNRKNFSEDTMSFFKCFCIVRNGSKILNTTSPKGQIDCFQGLRFLCNIWIIGFHTAYLYIGMLRHVEDMKSLFDWRVSQLLLNGGFAVDVFFVISGFLNAKSLFHMYSKSNGNISWFYFYFKRFLRLIPVYMIVLGFNTTLLTYSGNGTLWPTYDTNPICQKDWWSYLLFINNLKETAKQCLSLYWYMAADMQFYVISPLFLVPLMRWPRFGYALILACISGSSIISFILTYQYNLIDGFSRFEFHMGDLRNYSIKFWEYFDILYEKPYARIIPYLVAILLVNYFEKRNLHNGKTRNTAIHLCCGWILTAIFMWICFFYHHKKEEILIVTAIYNGTKHVLFSCGLAWIIYLLLTRQSEFLNKCLSWKYFFPLSRLSYCAYLIHPLILPRIILQSQDFMDFSYTSMIWLYLYICGYTYVISFFVSMLFEIPVLNLWDWYLRKKVKKNSSVTSFSPTLNFFKLM